MLRTIKLLFLPQMYLWYPIFVLTYISISNASELPEPTMGRAKAHTSPHSQAIITQLPMRFQTHTTTHAIMPLKQDA